MADVLWTQHPSLRSHAGRIVAWLLVGVALAAGRWWLPLLAAKLQIPTTWQPGIEAVQHWSWVALAIPVVHLGCAWITSRLIRYDLTADRLLVTRGLLMRRVDNLELYRVRDLHLELPLLPRLLGVGDVVLDTVDHSTPSVVLTGVKKPAEVFARIRELTEACRKRAGIPGALANG